MIYLFTSAKNGDQSKIEEVLYDTITFLKVQNKNREHDIYTTAEIYTYFKTERTRENRNIIYSLP